MDKWNELHAYVRSHLEPWLYAKTGLNASEIIGIAQATVQQFPGCHVPLVDCFACRQNADTVIGHVKRIVELAQGDSTTLQGQRQRCSACGTPTLEPSKVTGYSYCTRCGKGSIPTVATGTA